MITFELHLPKLDEAQQFHLEEVLLKAPRVDAFPTPQTDGSVVLSVTSAIDNAILREAVLAIYGWASENPTVHPYVQVVCGDKKQQLMKHSPNDMIHFLATC